MRVGRLRLFSFVGLVWCTLLSLSGSRADASFTMPSMSATSLCSINCELSGVVSAVVSPTQFVYNSWGARGRVIVVDSPSMVWPVGSPIKVGQTVKVTGSFNRLGTMIAARVTIFSLNHIATFAYDDYYGEGGSASPASVSSLLTYVQSAGKGLADCHSSQIGCKTVFYLRPYAEVDLSPTSCQEHPDEDILAVAPESWYVHNTGYSNSAHRVYGKDKDGCIMWAMNPNATGMQTWWRNYLQANANSYDLFYVDMSPMDLADATSYHSGGGCLPYPSYCRSTQELPTNAAVVAGHVNFVNAMRYRNGNPMYFIYQQAYPTRTLSLDLGALASTRRYAAVTCEGCLAEVAPGPVVVPSNYEPYLDEMAAINKTSDAFLVMSKGDYPAGSANQILQRLVTTGVVWLAYSEGHTIVQPDLERNTKNLAVWPEDLIYPDAPLESMVSGAADLQVSPGVYRREFASCYQRGLLFGHCAALVNANRSSVTIRSPWLRQAYHHVITLRGGDVLSGGSANIAGARFVPGSTWIQGGGAIMLAP